MRRKIRRATGAVALGLAAVVVATMTSASPAAADASYIQLAPGVQSPQYSVNGCRYKVVYTGYGTTPVAGASLYNSACNGTIIGVKSADGSGVHWTQWTSGSHTGSDGCGTYTGLLVAGPDPGYAIGLYIWVPGGSFGSGLRFYGYDGLQGQNIHSLC